MTKKEQEVFRFLMQQYKKQYDENQYNRTNYDSDLEYYIGHRNPENYPLAYNESFNRILPIIYTILSRFMDQLYQAGNIISVKPRKSTDNVKAVEAVLNYQMETLNDIDMQGGSYLTMMKWMFNAITFGKGIVKVYWRKEERISPKRIGLPVPNFDRFGRFQGMDTVDHLSQVMQTVYNGPYVEVLHNKLFVPDTKHKSIQKMPFVFLVYPKTIDEIKKKQEAGIYKNIKELGWSSGGGAGVEEKDSDEAWIKSIGLEAGISASELNETLKTPELDIIEAYGKMILKDSSYEVGSGYKIKGKEEEVIVHIGNYKTILSIQRNTYGIKPLFDIGCYIEPELFWDIGMVKLTKGIQEQVNNLANLRMQNAMLLVNQMMRVNPDSDIPPAALTWKPFGIVPAERDEVEPLTVPDYNSNLFMEQENFYDNAIHDLMGMYPYSMGESPQRQERTGVVYSIQSMGEARAKLLLMSMDYLGIRPLLKYMMLLNTFHLPSGFEYRISKHDQTQFGQIFGQDIHPDFDFSPRYTGIEPALGKQARSQQLMQMAGAWAQDPWINQYQFKKTIMELMDVRDADALLKTPDQFQKEIQQQATQQMKAQQTAQQMEAQAKMAQDRQKQQLDAQAKSRQSAQDFQEEQRLKAQDLRGERALNEQEFQYDMALKAVEEETKAQNEKSS